MKNQIILLTGATGYIGGRLVPQLLDLGYRVRCVVRQPRKLQSETWVSHPAIEVIQADVCDTMRIAQGMAGCSAAFYLVHSMMSGGTQYRTHDKRNAQSFANAATHAHLGRIIYLGGLGETGEGLSEHLASRREVEHVLASGTAKVTVLRAAMIIGSGSASFEILRYLVKRLPVMITPRWVNTQCQPIAIDNVLHYLAACLETPETVGRTLDIGGTDVMSYREIMHTMACAMRLRRRLIIPVPVLTPRLSSLWIQLVTPVSHRIARPLAEGLKNRVVCRDPEAARVMPQRLLSVRQAIDAAIAGVHDRDIRPAQSK